MLRLARNFSLISAVLLAQYVAGQIPKPCANAECLSARSCCPTPEIENVQDAGPCGEKLNRGVCRWVGIPEVKFNNTDGADIRENWPIQYFNRTCSCNKPFGDYDCGGCSAGHTGNDCSQRIILRRKPTAELTTKEWNKYLDVIHLAKITPSRYMVVTDNYSTSVEKIIAAMINPTIYDFFTWVHYLVTKDDHIKRGTIFIK